MTVIRKPGDPVPHVHDHVAEILAGAGLSPAITSALLEFDVANFQWMRVVAKGELPSVILRRLDLDLDLAHFHGLTAVIRIQFGVGRAASDATIGLVAEEMSVDPSRASRIVADLVARGYVRRDVAQDDGRRSVLTLTDDGKKVMESFRAEKWAIMARVFRDWTPDAIASFARATQAYTEGVQAVLSGIARAD